jgi:DNA polymerase-3 subunit alpha
MGSNSRNGSHADDADPAPRFVHTDVLSAYSMWCSPSTPEAYVRALARQYPIAPDSDSRYRPALAIADYGLHSAVKTAVACDREGIDRLRGLRVRVVPERSYRTWGERAAELILLAMDETGWLSLVGLANRGFLAGADRGRPRVDWHDLESFRDGVIAITGMPGGGGILSAAIEHAGNPAEPIEAFGLTRRLMELYPSRLYLELAFHGNPVEKLVNRGLVAIAQRMDLPTARAASSPCPSSWQPTCVSLLSAYAGLWVFPAPADVPTDLRDPEVRIELRRRLAAVQLDLFAHLPIVA